METNDKSVDLIWVSANFSSVFFSEKAVKRFLKSLMPKNGDTSIESDIEFLELHLNKKYSKNEIMNATPEQLKMMRILH